MGERAVIEMRGVSCHLGGRRVLKDVSWRVGPGEHWAVVGLNGSGKTTLLNLINGYVFPSSGQVRVLGESFGSYDWRLMRRRIGYVSSFLEERLYQSETALEIALSGLYATIGLYDNPGPGHRKKALAALERAGMAGAARKPYAELSQGEKQRVLVARALAGSPRLLILDEPCAGLDIFARESLLSAMETLGRSDGAPTMLYVSHHIEEITPVFTHVLLLRRGEVHSAGRRRKVLGEENLSSFFEAPVKVSWRGQRAWVNL
ncbi:MAG: ABC transporter ATP-binding protein [Thermodesulfovibrionales bacterium]